MKYGEIKRFQTGVAVPLFSLRSESGCGIGEFADLALLAEWCHKTGFDLIQILPINDSGENLSPYSARSAFALNPIFLHLPAIPGALVHRAAIEAAAQRFNSEMLVPYLEVYRFKLSLLKTIYFASQGKESLRERVARWISKNEWVKGYAVYCVLKDRHQQRSWVDWPAEQRDFDAPQVATFWDEYAVECRFVAWCQMLAEQQLRDAVQHLNRFGVRLKGDIPILIDEDSADVWLNRRYFDRRLKAGAPPDMFSKTGQNWGFPTYNWDELEKDGYRWWIDRLKHCDDFYHAYRIDHVLGFFRIWVVPERENTAMLGWFHPSHAIDRSDLLAAGLSDHVADRLVRPAWTSDELEQLLGQDVDEWFEVVDGGRLALRPELNEKSIADLPVDDELKEKLHELYWDRIYVSDSSSNLYPYWYWAHSSLFNALSEADQQRVRGLMHKTNQLQDRLWRETGRKLLRMMQQATDMLVCAEDLGVVPDCVPEVLEELKILGLRVDRWTRNYQADGEPFLEMENYPRLSVCTTSTHDTETLRGVWEAPHFNRWEYVAQLEFDGDPPAFLTTDIAAASIQRALSANSVVTVIPLQDWFSLHYDLRFRLPEEERINVPGTMNEVNWRWRMKDSLEHLLAYKTFNAYVKQFIDARRDRPL